MSNEDKVSAAQKYQTAIIALKFCYFAYYFSVGCIHNFYPIILKKQNLPNSKIGVLASIGLIGGTISPIIIGYLADKTKRTRLILIIITIFTIFFHAIPISTISIKSIKDGPPAEGEIRTPSESFIYLLFFFQFFVTFGDQGTKALMDGVVHKVIGECNKLDIKHDFAHVRLFGGLGVGIATILSGFALDRIKNYMPFGLPEDFFLVFLCVSMGSILIVVLIMYTPVVETKKQVSFLGAIMDLFQSAGALICFLTQFLIHFAINLTRHFEAIYIQHLGGNKTLTGIAQLTGYATDVLMMYLSPTICDMIGGYEATIAIGSFVSALRCVFYGYADSKYLAFNNFILTGFSLGLIIPCMSSLVKTKAPEHLISSYVSLLIATGKIGGAIASYSGGNISERYSYAMLFIIGAIFFALSAVIIIGLKFLDLIRSKLFSSNKKKHDPILMKNLIPV